MANTSSRGARWNALRKACLERDGHLCAYCGREATTADHIVPRKAGGKDELANLVAACRSCNSSKGAKMLTRTNYFNPRWLVSL